MFKKLMVTALLVCSLPVAASAGSWMFSTWAKNAGGSITSDNFVGQTYLNSAIQNSYSATGRAFTGTVTADTGYTISKISYGDFAAMTTTYPGTTSATVTLPASANNKAFYVYFKANTLAVTATAGTGATVNTTSLANVTIGTKLTTPFTFRFTPKAGYTVGLITVTPGLNANLTNVTTVQGGVNQLSTVTFPAGYVFTGPVAISSANGTTTTVIAVPPASQTVMLPASAMTLTGSSINGNATYSRWSSVSRPAGAAQPFTAATGSETSPSFTPAVAGIYRFLYRASNGTLVSNSNTSVTASTSFAASARTQCYSCHIGANKGIQTFPNWSSSSYKTAGVMCYTCHLGANTGGHPGTIAGPVAGHDSKNLTCNKCHNPSQAGTQLVNSDAHKIDTATGCVDCHSVAQNAGATFVQDNSGVRSITNEFTRWSHHVVGVTANDGHCAACHLEGKVVGAEVVVDKAYHMKDASIYLRNADTDAAYVWTPNAPNFSNMDNFCMSCHDADGATSAGSVLIQGWLNADVARKATGKTASASNPFGDLISNDYDFEERPAVVNASSQFNTSNNSHHAVKGKKYTGRTRTGTDRVIADVAAFTANSSAAMPGKRSTIYDSFSQGSNPTPATSSVRKFEQLYITLSDLNTVEAAPRMGGKTLGDDSTLHCADCHTVGQFAARGSVAYTNMSAAYWTQSGGTAGLSRYNKGAIGAHGSANEYMLRNNVGTNARHQGAETVVIGGNADNGTYGTKPYLVCFNCHAFNAYGTVTSNNGETGINHGGEYSKDSRCNGPYNTVFGNMTGETRLRSMVTATGAVNTAGIGVGATAANKTGGIAGGGYANFVGAGNFYGNIYGIQCANCHNSGVKDNIFGGIHGSGVDQTYTDGMGNTSKHFRFFPGLGNIAYVPGVKGGFTGGTLATYKAYSGSRDGSNTTGTANVGGAYGTANQSFKLLPVRTIKNTAAGENTKGSYQYVTGGVSNDLNWEQRVQQSIAGQQDLQSAAMGCYTLTPPTGNYTYSTGAESTAAFSPANVAAMKLTISVQPLGQQVNPKVFYPSVYQTDGAAADIRDAATTGATNAEGHQLFDAWGGCDDHNGAAGAGTGMVRKVLRPVSY